MKNVSSGWSSSLQWRLHAKWFFTALAPFLSFNPCYSGFKVMSDWVLISPTKTKPMSWGSYSAVGLSSWLTLVPRHYTAKGLQEAVPGICSGSQGDKLAAWRSKTCRILWWGSAVQGIEARDMSQAVMDDVRGYMGKDRRPGLDTTLQISLLNLVSTVTFCPINVPWCAIDS